jgi:hypothetical protein
MVSEPLVRFVMATPQQKAFCVLRFDKRESAITVQRDFRKTEYPQMLEAFDVSTDRSKKVRVRAKKCSKVDLATLTKTTSSVFDKVSFGVHRSLHVVRA